MTEGQRCWVQLRGLPGKKCHGVSTPIFISLLLLLSCPSLKTQACQQLLWPLPSPLVAFRAKGMIHVMDFSTSQGGGIEHSSDQCFWNLYTRATNLCNTSSPPMRPPLP
uniref:Uncharacterized protein n=1 Tax=Monodon monoceros TaxID=40151 RepID=A0A8C6AK97_MONMO